MVIKPEARAAAKLDGERLVFAGVTVQQSRLEIILGRQIAHAALQAGLPADAKIAERLRIANIAGTAEFAHVDVRFTIAARGKIAAASNPIIAAQNRRGFDTIADGVSEIIDFGGRQRSRRWRSHQQRSAYSNHYARAK